MRRSEVSALSQHSAQSARSQALFGAAVGCAGVDRFCVSSDICYKGGSASERGRLIRCTVLPPLSSPSVGNVLGIRRFQFGRVPLRSKQGACGDHALAMFFIAIERQS